MNARRIPSPVTTILISINVVVFVLTMYFSLGVQHGGAVGASVDVQGRIWTFITSMFLHGSIAHLACNMISLAPPALARPESTYRRVRYLILYSVSGIVGELPTSPSICAMGAINGAVGASGAIFGFVRRIRASAVQGAQGGGRVRKTAASAP